MKILYINSDSPDYMSDSLFHGFYNLLGEDFTHLHDYDLMYKKEENFEKLKKEYGRGFTIWNNLPENFNDNSDIQNKIRTHYFDYIIYGSIHRKRDLLSDVLQYCDKSEICFIDGEDHKDLSKHYDPKILYFKRELTLDIDNFPFKNIYPISFSIPKEKITTNKPKKERFTAQLILGNISTYIFYNETDYYNDYKKSYFGITHKKAGWDCLRHYEILMNNCLPYFRDIEICPKNIMTNFPKKDIIVAKNLFHNFIEDKYYEMLNKLFEYTLENLTTEKAAKYILNKLMKNK